MRIAILIILCSLFIACHKRPAKTRPQTSIESVKSDTIRTQVFPHPVGVVNDFENILSNQEEKELSDTLQAFLNRTGNHIVIVSIDSLKQFQDIAEYTTELGNTWAVGDSAKDNGVLIVLSRKLRVVRVATGKGTEKVLSDRFCKRVIERDMLPEFRGGNYFSGLKKGVLSLIREWEKH